jgi:hypothetical protein
MWPWKNIRQGLALAVPTSVAPRVSHLLLLAMLALAAGSASAESRVTSGLVSYYPFTEGVGTTVADQSGVGTPMNLQLSGSVTWLAGQRGVSFNGGRVGTSGAASKVIGALRASGHSTFEVWALPAKLKQYGPARLLSVGKDATYQNFMLGQKASDYQARLLHTAKNAAAWPYLLTGSGSVAVAVQHVVHTYDGSVERLYVDGVQQPETVVRTGNYSNWRTTDAFSIGNEVTLEKAFQGEVYLAAVYDRALSAAEVQQNYAAGPSGTTSPPSNTAPVVNAGRTGT